MTRGRGQSAWGMGLRVEEEEQNNVERSTFIHLFPSTPSSPISNF